MKSKPGSTRPLNSSFITIPLSTMAITTPAPRVYDHAGSRFNPAGEELPRLNCFGQYGSFGAGAGGSASRLLRIVDMESVMLGSAGVIPGV